MVKSNIDYNEYINIMLFNNIFRLENTLLKSDDDWLDIENNIVNLFKIKLNLKQKKVFGVVENNMIKIDNDNGKLVKVYKLEIETDKGNIEIEVLDEEINDNVIDLTELDIDFNDKKYVIYGEFLT